MAVCPPEVELVARRRPHHLAPRSALGDRPHAARHRKACKKQFPRPGFVRRVTPTIARPKTLDHRPFSSLVGARPKEQDRGSSGRDSAWRALQILGEGCWCSATRPSRPDSRIPAATRRRPSLTPTACALPASSCTKTATCPSRSEFERHAVTPGLQIGNRLRPSCVSGTRLPDRSPIQMSPHTPTPLTLTTTRWPSRDKRGSENRAGVPATL